MEHKIILGGEAFLPFARSRVKALLALGLPYADQSFEVEGVSIKVRIEPGHEYIRIEGGSCSTAMDSGVVNLITWFSQEPTAYDPGILHETNGVAAYQSGFAPTDPVTERRLKPSKTSDGQLAGIISYGAKFSGKVPYDAKVAKSFMPSVIRNDTTTPPSFDFDPADDGLVVKKIMADLCPASMFTGKTRLWVQALYGRHRFDNAKFDVDGEPLAVPRASIPIATVSNYTLEGGIPSINIAPYVRAGDTTEYRDILLTTGAGVFLDPETGKHWLFITGTDGVWSYPLIASTCGEKMRKHLKASSTLLNSTDREHLEAYVLSSCQPDAANVVSMPFAASIPAWSLGYSWHWNWTGLTADIVVNDSFWQRRVLLVNYYAMRSTHRRITITPTQVKATDTEPAKTTFAMSQTIIEGPKDWAVEQELWCIAEPDWGAKELLKTTPKFSDVMDCDAPFYAFYVRNELKVCRVKVVITETETTRETSTGFDSAAPLNAGLTYGLGGGYGETLSTSGRYFTATFTIGSEVFTGLYAYRAASGYRVEVSGKTQDPDPEPLTMVHNYTGVIGTIIDQNNENRGSMSPGPWGYATQGWYPVAATYSIKRASVAKYWHSSFACIVPFGNAEAVYCDVHTDTTTYSSGVTTEAQYANGFVTCFRWSPLGIYRDVTGWSSWIYCYASGGLHGTTGGTTEQVNQPDETTNAVTQDRTILISHAGVTPADVTNDLYFGRFHDFNYESVPSTFETLTGTSTANPVVIAPIYVVPPIGVSTTAAAGMPALVGWV